MVNWGPLYIKPIGCKTTDEERRAGYEYASAHLVKVSTPRTDPGNWDYFTTDPTDRHAAVVAIARPSTGAESSRFGDLAYVAALYEDHARYCTQHDDTARAMVSFYTAHKQPEKAERESQEARRYRQLAQDYRDAAARIRAQWTH